MQKDSGHKLDATIVNIPLQIIKRDKSVQNIIERRNMLESA